MTTTILGPDDPALVALQEEIADHPEIDARLDIVAWAEYQPALQATLSAAEAPYQAVCVPGHMWLPDLVAGEKVLALEPILKTLEPAQVGAHGFDDVVPSIARECRVDGALVMLPLFTDGHLVFYRGDLVQLPEKVRVSDWPTIVSDWQLPEAMWPLALKADASEILLDWLPMLWAHGGDVLDAEGRVRFDDARGVAALEAYCDLRALAHPDSHRFGNNDVARALATGAAAAVVSWGGQAAAIFDGATNPWHAVIKTAQLADPWNATWGISLPANQSLARARAAAGDLLALTGPAFDQKVTRIAGSPTRIASYSPEACARYPWLADQRDMLAACRTLPAEATRGQLLGALYGAVHQAFTGAATPAAALASAVTAVSG
ncbi:MAG TPA: extracellular solute-binding protein [Anaerolineales bacterium]|nr:extracellular solute-binding protein [Anaerolineales bacterium]